MSNDLVWQSVSWRRGEEHYDFEIERGGLLATLKAPGGRAMTLPMVVWEGLLDALRASRETKARSEQRFPVRSKARWYDGETTELAESFRNGKSIAELAKAHHRSEYAIENQLDRMGLISNAATYGPGGRPTGGSPGRAEGNNGLQRLHEGAGVHPLDAPFAMEALAGEVEIDIAGRAPASPSPPR